jgi:hypothetical protein
MWAISRLITQAHALERVRSRVLGKSGIVCVVRVAWKLSVAFGQCR